MHTGGVTVRDFPKWKSSAITCTLHDMRPRDTMPSSEGQNAESKQCSHNLSLEQSDQGKKCQERPLPCDRPLSVTQLRSRCGSLVPAYYCMLHQLRGLLVFSHIATFLLGVLHELEGTRMEGEVFTENLVGTKTPPEPRIVAHQSTKAPSDAESPVLNIPPRKPWEQVHFDFSLKPKSYEIKGTTIP
jgi:hypothetical protein